MEFAFEAEIIHTPTFYLYRKLIYGWANLLLDAKLNNNTPAHKMDKFINIW